MPTFSILSVGEARGSSVVLPYLDSLLDIETFLPTRDSWEDLDDREVICSLYDLEYLYMEGSMRGSGR